MGLGPVLPPVVVAGVDVRYVNMRPSVYMPRIDVAVKIDVRPPKIQVLRHVNVWTGKIHVPGKINVPADQIQVLRSSTALRCDVNV